RRTPARPSEAHRTPYRPRQRQWRPGGAGAPARCVGQQPALPGRDPVRGAGGTAVSHRDAVVLMGVAVTAAVALAAGYLPGRLRPWRRPGGWTADQVRFTGTWVQGGTARQAVVALVHL